MAIDKELFKQLKEKVLDLDPVTFCEKHLTLDGNPFKLTNNGYKPFSDIYRYIGIKALEKGALPVVMVKGRQVGGTTMASALEMYFMGCGAFGTNGKPPMRILHAFPHLEAAAQYSKTKLNPMITGSQMDEAEKEKANKGGRPKTFMQKLLDSSSPTNDSLSFKQFINDNYVSIDSTGIDADRLRGRTVDAIFFDEVQDTSGEALRNATKILAKSKYGETGKGVQVYFGTPKKKGSDFYKMWAASNQQYFHLGCAECKQYFPLYTPGSDDWEKIWLHGFTVKCTHCGHEQHKDEAAERGKWIASNPDDYSAIGFHINQLYMPGFTKETIMAEKPGVNPLNTERVYQNEVLGEFYQGDSSPISEDEIRELCGDIGRKMRQSIAPSEEQLVFLGIDYGARADQEQLANPNRSKNQGQSYSTAVLLVPKGPHLLSVEYAFKFKRNDPESKKGIIEQIMRQYSVNLVVADIGYSNDFSYIMHSEHGDKYLISRAHAKVNKKVEFKKEVFPKEILFERDFYIAEIFEKMKKGEIRFPYGDYERISWLISHCASMDIKPSLSKYGDHTMHYVKGSTPNDGLMALLNAYLAYKFVITKGFTTQNSLLQEHNLKDKNKILAVTGLIHRRV